MSTLSRRKRIVFALVAMSMSFGVILTGLLAADLYAHRRVERSAGFNRYGYRGSVVGRKSDGGTRIVMLGGSTVYGFDVEYDEALPVQLERQLSAVVPGVDVVNLGFSGAGVVTFVPNLRTYEYLDYDVVVLYEGYNDILGDAAPNTLQKRHDSPLFRLTGYYPILPQVLREKAGFLTEGRRAERATFRPGLANRTSASALLATSAIAETLGRQLDRLVDPVQTGPVTSGCGAPWAFYCSHVAAAVRYAVDHGKLVLVVGQPLMRYGQEERHASQQRALAEMLARDFPTPRVRYVSVADAVDLSDNTVATDGLHLRPAATAIVAARLVAPLRELMQLPRAE